MILPELNECRRIRDELSNQNHETANLTNKLDRVSTHSTFIYLSTCLDLNFKFINVIWNQEIHSLRAELEAAKYDVIKYCIGSLVSISAVGLAVLRIVM